MFEIVISTGAKRAILLTIERGDEAFFVVLVYIFVQQFSFSIHSYYRIHATQLIYLYK